MKGYIAMALLAVLVLGSWYKFDQSGQEVIELEKRIFELQNQEATDEEIGELEIELKSMEGPRIFAGILLTFLSAGLAGIVFATVILPIIAEKITHAVYDSNEEVEPDPFHQARVCIAQGDWHAAITCFKKAAEKDPMSRTPWVEIAKIQRENLDDSQGAIRTLADGIEGQEWEIDDVAFLMFRMIEIYDEDLGDRDLAALYLSQVVELFPNTRHSANARSQLREWGLA